VRVLAELVRGKSCRVTRECATSPTVSPRRVRQSLEGIRLRLGSLLWTYQWQAKVLVHGRACQSPHTFYGLREVVDRSPDQEWVIFRYNSGSITDDTQSSQAAPFFHRFKRFVENTRNPWSISPETSFISKHQEGKSVTRFVCLTFRAIHPQHFALSDDANTIRKCTSLHLSPYFRISRYLGKRLESV
jgi:hypothetical protein